MNVCFRFLKIFQFAAAFSAVMLSSFISARDYYDTDEIRYPLDAGGEPGFLNSYYGLLEFSGNAIHYDSRESFYIKGSGAPVIYRKGDVFGVNLYFSSILINGPVGPDEQAANIGNFWMNAVQFEYGTDFNMRFNDLDFAYSYSRSSQHPFRDQYSYAAADRQILRLRCGSFTLFGADFIPGISAEYSDLYGFWESDLGKPRALFVISPELRIEKNFSDQDALYGFFAADGIYTWKGDVEAGFYGETGVKKDRRNGFEFFLQFYYSEDTEMMDGRQHEAMYAGFGIRFR